MFIEDEASSSMFLFCSHRILVLGKHIYFAFALRKQYKWQMAKLNLLLLYKYQSFFCFVPFLYTLLLYVFYCKMYVQ